jgi:hypothetical protein
MPSEKLLKLNSYLNREGTVPLDPKRIEQRPFRDFRMSHAAPRRNKKNLNSNHSISIDRR